MLMLVFSCNCGFNQSPWYRNNGGNPIEFSSLQDFFGKYDTQKQHIALGSVKSQIGHTKAAAGTASLIKTA